MPSARKSQEEVITEYFETADLAKIEVVFNIVKGTVKRRLGAKPAVEKKPRSKKAAATASAAEELALQ